jgi:hypothetical protein
MTPVDPADVPRPRAQLHFGVFFQGVNNTTIWSSPDSGSQISPLSFRQVAQTAERGLFDAFFLGEGLRLREVGGRIHDLDIAATSARPRGWPISSRALSAMAPSTGSTCRLISSRTVSTTSLTCSSPRFRSEASIRPSTGGPPCASTLGCARPARPVPPRSSGGLAEPLGIASRNSSLYSRYKLSI